MMILTNPLIYQRTVLSTQTKPSISVKTPALATVHVLMAVNPVPTKPVAVLMRISILISQYVQMRLTRTTLNVSTSVQSMICSASQHAVDHMSTFTRDVLVKSCVQVNDLFHSENNVFLGGCPCAEYSCGGYNTNELLQIRRRVRSLRSRIESKIEQLTNPKPLDDLAESNFQLIFQFF